MARSSSPDTDLVYDTIHADVSKKFHPAAILRRPRGVRGGFVDGCALPSRAFCRSYSSMAITITRPCFATATGAARARLISRPNPYFASFAVKVCMREAPFPNSRHGFWMV